MGIELTNVVGHLGATEKDIKASLERVMQDHDVKAMLKKHAARKDSIDLEKQASSSQATEAGWSTKAKGAAAVAGVVATGLIAHRFGPQALPHIVQGAQAAGRHLGILKPELIPPTLREKVAANIGTGVNYVRSFGAKPEVIPPTLYEKVLGMIPSFK